MKKRKKNIYKDAMSILKGFSVEWHDTNPSFENKDLKDVKCSHKNPIHRLCVDKIFEVAKVWIFRSAKVQWFITITTVFEYDNGMIDKHTNEIEFFGVFNSINDFAIDLMRQQRRLGNADKFSRIEFKALCSDIKPKSKVEEDSELIQIEVAS